MWVVWMWITNRLDMNLDMNMNFNFGQIWQICKNNVICNSNKIWIVWIVDHELKININHVWL